MPCFAWVALVHVVLIRRCSSFRGSLNYHPTRYGRRMLRRANPGSFRRQVDPYNHRSFARWSRSSREDRQFGDLEQQFDAEYDNEDSSILLSLEDLEDEEEADFLRRELAHLESLEEILAELDESRDFLLEDDDELMNQEGIDPDDLLEDSVLILNELLGSMDDGDGDGDVEAGRVKGNSTPQKDNSTDWRKAVTAELETALLQGVVPVSAGVGDDSIPGDFGFDPLQMSTKDVFAPTQKFMLKLLRGEFSSDAAYNDSADPQRTTKRPRALILRDYREAEIRHSRLAMLAAVFWPLQEMLDRLILEPDQYGPLIYGPVTLPYFPLLMTLIMLLLGYLDIYSQAIKEMDGLGEAYLPGDCFWDPLRILTGTSDATKRRMQERELFNGRAAMLAVLVFIWEEAVTHQPVIDVAGNELLFEPAYQIPFIQTWLDAQFSPVDPTWPL